MFAVGVCAGPSDNYDQLAGPSIVRCCEPDSRCFVVRGQRSIATAYNRILDEARGAEVVLLIHDDVELLDAKVCSKLREIFADSTVALAGVIGARGVQSLAWWQYGVVGGRVSERQPGRDRLLEGTPGAGTHDVDTLDGILLAFSPWAVEHLRFDTRYPGFDGYDADICAQARAAGKRVVTFRTEVAHYNNSRAGGPFHQADLLWRARWIPMARHRRALLRARAVLLRSEYRFRRICW